MSLVLSQVAVRHAGQAPLFAPVSLTVDAGQMAVVMGPSGVGKSTLLDMVGGHLAHGFTGVGSVVLDGRDVTGDPPEARRIGLLFQDALLFPHLSVGANLAFGLTRRIRGRRARIAAVETALDQAGLPGLADRDPATLSGGQRARAALMRTLLAEPRAVLLDEPFSKLDTDLRGEMRAFTLDLIRRLAIPALMVTHDPEDARAACGPVINLAPPGGNEI